jgi:CRISPR-associated protein Csd2
MTTTETCKSLVVESSVVNCLYDIVVIFDVHGNPNGDPDSDNHPRQDFQTGLGYITDASTKRHIRDYVMMNFVDVPGMDIWIKPGAVLNQAIQAARQRAGVPLVVKGKDQPKSLVQHAMAAQAEMTRTYYDVRAFGGMMATEADAGRNCGPVQVSYAISVDPITVDIDTVTRMAVATEQEAKKQGGQNRTMGRNYRIPYAVYKCHTTINPFRAEQNRFTEHDLTIYLEALLHMHRISRSAGRDMSTLKVVVFRHPNKLGVCNNRSLVDCVQVKKLVDHPRSPKDYEITVDTTGINPKIEVIVLDDSSDVSAIFTNGS